MKFNFDERFSKPKKKKKKQTKILNSFYFNLYIFQLKKKKEKENDIVYRQIQIFSFSPYNNFDATTSSLCFKKGTRGR